MSNAKTPMSTFLNDQNSNSQFANTKGEEIISKFNQFLDLFQKEVTHYNPISADSEIIQFLINSFSELLEDGLVEAKNADNDLIHYWFVISSALDSESIRFVESIEQFQTDSEKAYVWILIELNNKNLLNIFEDIASHPNVVKYYTKNSIIRKYKDEVSKILRRLMKIDYKIESKFLKTYEEQMNSHSGGLDPNELYGTNKNGINVQGVHDSGHVKQLSVEEVMNNIERYKIALHGSTRKSTDDWNTVYINHELKKQLEQEKSLLGNILAPGTKGHQRQTSKMVIEKYFFLTL